jgi:peptidoglycan/xylan/chitin deacetylase (PgdA/CDA1 family)
MEAAGAAIAVHGYRHLCRNRASSLLNLHPRTEFAGVEINIQREWIRNGFAILRENGLNPRLWVAPRHGFDHNTLRALRDTGIEYLSDGFARVPLLRGGVTWLPQQLWSPVTKKAGLWTICIHPSLANSLEWQRLRSFLEKHAAQFTSFDRVVNEFSASRLGLNERIYERIALWRVQRRYGRRRRKNK